MNICQLKRLFAPLTHLHDDRYYTETEVDGLLSSKSDVGHSHPGSSGSDQILIVDKKAYNESGGDFTQDTWLTRDLTDVLIDTGGNVTSLSSNQVQLANGVYRIGHISAPAYKVDRHFLRWISVSGTPNIEILGSAEYAYYYYTAQTRSFAVNSNFTCDGHVFELQHRCSSTKADGMGVSTYAVGVDSIYSIVHLERIG